MGNVYSKSLRSLFESSLNLRSVVAASVDTHYLDSVHEGIFASKLGADVLVNGVVPEIIVAKHMGMQCACFCIVEKVLTKANDSPSSKVDFDAKLWLPLFSDAVSFCSKS